MVLDLVRTVAPTVELLMLDEAKAHLRIEASDTDEDDLVTALIQAATDWLDGHSGLLGRALLSQTWKIRYDYAFPAWRIPIPLTPLLSITSVQYIDSTGALQTLSPTTYDVLDGPAAALQPAYGLAWPSPRSQTRAVTITFVAGYGVTAAAVPAPIVQAAKLLLGHLYAHREAVVGVDNRDSSAALPIGVADLIAPYRARSVA